ACLQSGPLDDAQAKALQPLLAALPPGSWTLVQVPVAGRWMVYMGRFADEEALAKKRAELSALKLAFDRPAAGFEPGLALGRFATEEAAQRALADLANRGVRSARVVLERPSQTRTLLRLGAVDAPLRGQLQPLQDALGAAGGLHPCDPAPANP
ncbi:MAG: SPOR domain-containing protein, partial [Rubrivivax sp.]|nr:SPOR domain-containing protein [Rubrivivax sp.]